MSFVMWSRDVCACNSSPSRVTRVSFVVSLFFISLAVRARRRLASFSFFFSMMRRRDGERARKKKKSVCVVSKKKINK